MRVGDWKVLKRLAVSARLKMTAAAEKGVGNFHLLLVSLLYRRREGSNGHRCEDKSRSVHVSANPRIGGTHLLTACAGFKETPRSCVSIFATFGYIKRRTARGPVRLTAGPPRRSAKHHEPGSFRLAGNLRLTDFRQRGFEKPRRDIEFKSMIDYKQSNIHLGATAIGSADRASDEETKNKRLSS